MIVCVCGPVMDWKSIQCDSWDRLQQPYEDTCIANEFDNGYIINTSLWRHSIPYGASVAEALAEEQNRSLMIAVSTDTTGTDSSLFYRQCLCCHWPDVCRQLLATVALASQHTVDDTLFIGLPQSRSTSLCLYPAILPFNWPGHPNKI